MTSDKEVSSRPLYEHLAPRRHRPPTPRDVEASHRVEAYLDERGYAPGEVIDDVDLGAIPEEDISSCRRTGLLEMGIAIYPRLIYLGPSPYRWL